MSIVEGEPIQNTVFVGDLHIHCTEAELQALFGPFGTITAVKIMRSQETGRNLSYGFVYYLHRDAAVAAINNLDGYLLRGRSLRYALLFFTLFLLEAYFSNRNRSSLI